MTVIYLLFVVYLLATGVTWFRDARDAVASLVAHDVQNITVAAMFAASWNLPTTTDAARIAYAIGWLVILVDVVLVRRRRRWSR